MSNKIVSHGKRMVSENLIKILKEMDSKNISIGDLAEVLENFADGDVQMKLTAGDNVQISEDNVISATDTTYTAGDNITIENGVISASAGGDLYLHNIRLRFLPTQSLNYDIQVNLTLYNNSNIQFTTSTLATFLTNFHINGVANGLMCTGRFTDSANDIVEPIYTVAKDIDEPKFWVYLDRTDPNEPTNIKFNISETTIQDITVKVN